MEGFVKTKIILPTHHSKQSSISVHGQISFGADPFDDHLPHRGGLELKLNWGQQRKKYLCEQDQHWACGMSKTRKALGAVLN